MTSLVGDRAESTDHTPAAGPGSSDSRSPPGERCCWGWGAGSPLPLLAHLWLASVSEQKAWSPFLLGSAWLSPAPPGGLGGQQGRSWHPHSPHFHSFSLNASLSVFLNLIFQLLLYLHSSCFNETKKCVCFPLLEPPGELQYKTNTLAFKIKILWVAFPRLMEGTKGWSKTN